MQRHHRIACIYQLQHLRACDRAFHKYYIWVFVKLVAKSLSLFGNFLAIDRFDHQADFELRTSATKGLPEGMNYGHRIFAINERQIVERKEEEESILGKGELPPGQRWWRLEVKEKGHPVYRLCNLADKRRLNEARGRPYFI